MAKKGAVKKTRKTKGKQPTRRRGWTSDEQFTYLNGLIPSFKTAQVNNTTQEMWSPIENYWFKTWPLPDLTEAETSAGVKDATRRKKIMDRIKAWFGNHARDPTTNAETSSKDVLNLRGRKPKKPSTLQAYQQLYYQEKLKAEVDKRWAEKLEHEKNHPPVPPERPLPEYPTIQFRNNVTRELYAKEKDDVKKAVQDYIDNSDHSSDSSDDGDDDGDGDGEDVEADEEEKQRIAHAKKINRAQKAAVNSMSLALAQVEREADVFGVVVLGFGDPELGGSIKVVSIGQGKNAKGHGFLGLYGPNWRKYVEEPLGDFVDELRPAQERAKLALPGTEALAEEHQPGEYKWRWLNGDSPQPRVGFARDTSRTPAAVSVQSTLQKASKLRTPSIHPPTPLHTELAVGGCPDGQVEDVVDAGKTPDNQQRDQAEKRISPIQLAEDSEPGEHSEKAGELPMIVEKDDGSLTSDQSEKGGKVSIIVDKDGDQSEKEGEAPIIVDKDGDQSEKEGEAPIIVDKDDDSRSGEGVEIGEGAGIDGLHDAKMSEKDNQDEKVVSPVIGMDMANKDTEIKDDQSWDNGEPLTEDERTYLLTLDAFSRTEDMKRRRRKRLELEAFGVPKPKDTHSEGDFESNNLSTTTNTTRSDTSAERSGSSMITSNPPPISLSPSKSASIVSSHPNRDTWPQWIKECVPELEKMVDNSAWKLLLWEWLDMEDLLGYPKGKSKKLCMLANTHRPREVGDWFQYGRRSWDKQPLIAATDIGRYSTDWWKWWASLQPLSRSSVDPLHMPRQLPADGEWAEIMKGSNNGFFVVLVALGWWAQGLLFANEDMKGWVQATADVLWVVDQMKGIAETRKRSRDDGDASETESITTSSRPPSKRAKTTTQ